MQTRPSAGLLSPFAFLLIAIGLAALPSPGARAAVSPLSALQPPGLYEKNLGQYPAEIAYRARFAGLDAAIHGDGTVSVYSRKSAANGARPLKLVPVGLDTGIRPPKASEPADFRTHYFRDGSSTVDVPHFGRVEFASAFPGIDLAYHSEAGKFEFDFIVAPRADPGRIRIRIEGADAIRVDADGDLAVESGGAVVLQRRPVAYQVRDGKRVPVKCAYVVESQGVVALALSSYDRDATLVIDPVVEYSSYLGGTSPDFASAVRPDSNGFVYVTGVTQSSNFPVVAALDSSLTGGIDVFVAKINPATGKAVYSTYIGGRDADSSSGIAVDTSGAVYVTGTSGSRYPVTAGAYRTSGTGTLGFVTKLSAAGNAMTYSTFLPGTRPAGIAVDAFGQAIVSGTAGTAFTTSPGTFQPVYGGSSGVADATTMGDAFALKLNANGTGVIFATFLGGSGTDSAAGVTLDLLSDRVVIAGSTTSANLPTANAYQANLRGTEDGFVTAFAPNGAALVASTYFGGIGQDRVTGIDADRYGNVFVSGFTTSDDLPTLNARLPRSSLLTRYGSTRKGFVAKFATSNLQPAFSTYAGSRSNCCDTAFGIAADIVGDAYVIGSVAVAELGQFQAINAFLSNNYVSTKFNASDVRESSYVAGYSRDGQVLRFQTIVAPCYDAEDCNRGAIGALMPGQVAVAGSTDTDWLPVSRLNTQPKIASVPFVPDAWVMTLVTENPKVQLAVSAGSVAAGATVSLTATSYTNAWFGDVTFWDDTVSIGTAPMVEGVARLNASFVPGVRRLTATFNADRTPLRLLAVTPNSCP